MELKPYYPFTPIIKYIPSRYKNLKDWQKSNQQKVYAFKDGRATESQLWSFTYAVRNIIKGAPSEWLVCFIPASNSYKMHRRYDRLAEHLEKTVDCHVSLSAITNNVNYSVSNHSLKDKEDFHQSFTFNFNEICFQHIILIDDIITTGRSLRTVGEMLIACKAKSVHGLCYALTIHPRTNSAR